MGKGFQWQPCMAKRAINIPGPFPLPSHIPVCMTALLIRAAAKEYGSKVQKLKQVCKAATIAIPPSVYTRVTSEQDVINRLKELLSKHGLGKDSSSDEIAAVKRKLKKDRDLDGEHGFMHQLDMSDSQGFLQIWLCVPSFTFAG